MRNLAIAALMGSGLVLSVGGSAFGQNTAPLPGRAVLVAIDDYKEARLDLPPNSSTTDAGNLAKLVEHAMGFRQEDILLLFNDKATKSGILRAIDDWLIKGTRPGDRVFFSYSGHGAQQPDRNGDEPDGSDETLVPWDTSINDAGTIGNMLTDDEMEARFKQLSDRQVMIVVDACHSGTISRAIDDIGDGAVPFMRTPLFGPFLQQAPAQPLAPRTSRGAVGDPRAGEGQLSPRAAEESFMAGSDNLTIWSAVTATQVALVERGANPYQGVFTRRFTAGLAERKADANGNGIVSYAELLNYVRDESQAYCEGPGRTDCRRNGGRLTPTLEASPSILARDILTGRIADDMPGQATDTLGQSNSRGLTLTILPKDRVRHGEKVVFQVESRTSGHLLMLDINADQQVTQIYPNEFSQRTNRRAEIAAGQVVRVPDRTYGFDFVAQPPLGDGVLIAILTQDPIELGDLRGRGFQPQAHPADYLAGIAQALMKTVAEKLEARGVRWSMAYATYNIGS